LETGDAVVALQNAPKTHLEIADIPFAISFAKTEEARQLIEIVRILVLGDVVD